MKDFRNFFKSLHPFRMSVFDDVVKKQENIITPYITKESVDRMIQVDVFSELMSKRIIFFGDEVNESTSNVAISQLLYMYSSDQNSDITMYINSPGGDVYSGLALYDTMQLIQDSSKDIKLNTIAVGLAASMGSILLEGGTRGCRSALRHSRVLIHQPLSGTGPGAHQATDISILSKETNTLKEELYTILSKASGKSYSEVYNDCERDHWLTAENCLPGNYGKFGLIDNIVTKLA